MEEVSVLLLQVFRDLASPLYYLHEVFIFNWIWPVRVHCQQVHGYVIQILLEEQFPLVHRPDFQCFGGIEPDLIDTSLLIVLVLHLWDINGGQAVVVGIDQVKEFIQWDLIVTILVNTQKHQVCFIIIHSESHQVKHLLDIGGFKVTLATAVPVFEDLLQMGSRLIPPSECPNDVLHLGQVHLSISSHTVFQMYELSLSISICIEFFAMLQMRGIHLLSITFMDGSALWYLHCATLLLVCIHVSISNLTV